MRLVPSSAQQFSSRRLIWLLLWQAAAVKHSMAGIACGAAPKAQRGPTVVPLFHCMQLVQRLQCRTGQSLVPKVQHAATRTSALQWDQGLSDDC